MDGMVRVFPRLKPWVGVMVDVVGGMKWLVGDGERGRFMYGSPRF